MAERAAQSVRALIRDAGGPQRLSPEAWRATLDALRVRWDAFIWREDRVPEALTEELLAVTAHDEVAHLASVVLAGLAADPDTGLDVMEERFRLAWDEARRRLMPGIAVDAGFWLAVTLFDMGRLDEAQAVLVEVQALVARAGDHGKIRARSRSLPDELRIVRGEWETAAPSLLAGCEGRFGRPSSDPVPAGVDQVGCRSPARHGCPRSTLTPASRRPRRAAAPAVQRTSTSRPLRPRHASMTARSRAGS